MEHLSMHAAFLVLLLVVSICTAVDGFQDDARDEFYYSFVTRVWACVIGWAVMLISVC